ncbi:MAG: Gfo/Idh/MocA family oxidoreductase [Lentisphaerales bacterium]|nr:Gfo/Idh/MocA family oxidoreductase [Lentisphaerales bacterium]
MEIKKIGIIMNGVTGRMGTNQHLERSIHAIMQEGGMKINDDLTLMPDPILTGRNENKLKALAAKYGIEKYTTDLQSVLDDSYYKIFFDSSGTQYRKKFVEMAVKAGKAIYCEKPTAITTEEALYLYELCNKAGLKNGVVQDKLWLPGLRKFQMLKEQGFFGKILSIKGDFGYWVYEGHVEDQPVQRPSWNYRSEDGGGMVIDMHCHWRYVIDNLFGEVKSVSCRTATIIDERVNEQGRAYDCTADDTAYATFELANGVHCQFVSSWNTRVRKDDLLTIQVDGTQGSAVVGLRKCLVQPHSVTPKAIWNPDIDSPINYLDAWHEVPDATFYDNAFKIQWEKFIRHVELDEPFRWSLLEGAKGVQLAEISLESHDDKCWKDIPELG